MESCKGKLAVYTREVTTGYTISLANSVHFAYSEDGQSYKPLNQNYGMLFAKADIDGNNQIVEKGLTAPQVCQDEKLGFCIVAVRTNADGSRDEACEGSVLLWTTEDFVNFVEHGEVKLSEYPSLVDVLKENKPVEGCLPEGAIGGNAIEISKEMGESLLIHWSYLYNTKIQVPEYIEAEAVEDVREVKATAVYSDGSAVSKAVCWDVSEVNFSVPGEYTISGRVKAPKYGFPLAKGYADPVACYWKGYYYYMATNDNTGDIGLYIRRAGTLEGLFAEDVKEYVILDKDTRMGFIQTFWAPELHIINDKLYILFAVSGEAFGPQCHMMELKGNGNPINAEDWETPIRVVTRDGGALFEGGITLDMTYLKVKDTSYLVWSSRINCCAPGDTGSMLYIATIDEEKPWVLTSDAVLLSRPLYGWENNAGTINNEGPFPLLTEDMVYLMYSGGAAGGETYTIGCLSIPCEGDLLNPTQWEKAKQPLLSHYSMEGIYGPGHNAFVVDEEGQLNILYHAQELPGMAKRCTGIHRVHFSKDGFPVLSMTGDRDLNPALAEVTIKVRIRETI